MLLETLRRILKWWGGVLPPWSWDWMIHHSPQQHREHHPHGRLRELIFYCACWRLVPMHCVLDLNVLQLLEKLKIYWKSMSSIFHTETHCAIISTDTIQKRVHSCYSTRRPPAGHWGHWEPLPHPGVQPLHARLIISRIKSSQGVDAIIWKLGHNPDGKDDLFLLPRTATLQYRLLVFIAGQAVQTPASGS